MFDQRKKILFVCYGLGIGGIETCLVNLLNVMPEEEFQIDVLLMNPEYDSKENVKTNVQYIDSFRYVMNTTDTMHEIREHGGILRNPCKFFMYCCFRILVKLHKNAWKAFRRLPKHYDIAVAYSQNDYSPYYVIDKVEADKKIMWYHNGAYEAKEKKYHRDQKYYREFDKVVAVSSDCKRMLQKKFDFSEGQLVVLHNICDADNVLKKSKEFVPESFSKKDFHIVTVGRMTSEKGADLAVEACKEICRNNSNIQWHWVGDGNQRQYIETKILQYGLQNNFILEGTQKNPYPYMKYADIYVQPSYYEAYSTTITEAKILEKPIIATDVGGMRDQLTDEWTGLIVPVEKDALGNAILKLLENRNQRTEYEKRLSKDPFNTNSFLEGYKKLFD